MLGWPRFQGRRQQDPCGLCSHRREENTQPASLQPQTGHLHTHGPARVPRQQRIKCPVHKHKASPQLVPPPTPPWPPGGPSAQCPQGPASRAAGLQGAVTEARALSAPAELSWGGSRPSRPALPTRDRGSDGEGAHRPPPPHQAALFIQHPGQHLAFPPGQPETFFPFGEVTG